MDKEVDELKICKVFNDLMDDYERTGGNLTRSQVEKLIVKRNLTTGEGKVVFERLESANVSLDDYHFVGGNEDDLVQDEFKDNDSSTFAIEQIITKNKLLTAKEEVELSYQMELGARAFAEIKSGIVASESHLDFIKRASQAREKMLLSNLGLIHKCAKFFSGMSTLTLEDLFQEGFIGLTRAVEKFDRTLGYKFSTYAMWWIRQAIIRALCDKGAVIRLPNHIHQEVLKFKKAYNLIKQINFDREPKLSEISEELDWDIDKTHFIFQVSILSPVSLDGPQSQSNGEKALDNVVSHYATPESETLDEEIQNLIETALSCLTKRESDILKKRYGIDSTCDEMTLEEVGRDYNLTRERIRQIQQKALLQLQNSRFSDELRIHLK
ncbi:MAG TPA: sigma-70 family RNA polymerase sigma factor [Kangiella sp.]